MLLLLCNSMTPARSGAFRKTKVKDESNMIKQILENMSRALKGLGFTMFHPCWQSGWPLIAFKELFRVSLRMLMRSVLSLATSRTGCWKVRPCLKGVLRRVSMKSLAGSVGFLCFLLRSHRLRTDLVYTIVSGFQALGPCRLTGNRLRVVSLAIAGGFGTAQLLRGGTCRQHMAEFSRQVAFAFMLHLFCIHFVVKWSLKRLKPPSLLDVTMCERQENELPLESELSLEMESGGLEPRMGSMSMHFEVMRRRRTAIGHARCFSLAPKLLA